MRHVTYDCVIIGGGPAGISAAIYLARSNRSCLVVDKQKGRWNHDQINENYLGFPKGIAAKKLRSLGKKQAKRFGALFSNDTIENIDKKDVFVLKGKKSTYKGKSIIIACGVTDFYPPFPHLQRCIGKSVFWCLLCDGYKVRNKKIVVVGHDDKAAETCLRLLTYTKTIILLTNCDQDCDVISSDAKTTLKKASIPILYGSIAKVKEKNGMIQKIFLDNGTVVNTSYMFSKQGARPNSHLASSLGVIVEGEGYIKINTEQQTNIPGVYAAGDVTNEFNHQIVTAVHEGATAAVSVNEFLLSDTQKLT